MNTLHDDVARQAPQKKVRRGELFMKCESSPGTAGS
jgi:hypothetical protein